MDDWRYKQPKGAWVQEHRVNRTQVQVKLGRQQTLDKLV